MSTFFRPADCKNIQLIEPDSDVLTEQESGSVDPTLSERGELILTAGQTSAKIRFTTQKLSANYRFEYLYVDALGIASPGSISCVPVNQTIFDFTVEFAGEPITDGYILRWRVVVISVVQVPQIDQPESIYVQLPMSSVFTYTLTNPRSTQDYGFSELRVENLIDLPGAQTPILAQVVHKEQTQFAVALSPSPNNNNYFLVARIP